MGEIVEYQRGNNYVEVVREEADLVEITKGILAILERIFQK